MRQFLRRGGAMRRLRPLFLLSFVAVVVGCGSGAAAPAGGAGAAGPPAAAPSFAPAPAASAGGQDLGSVGGGTGKGQPGDQVADLGAKIIRTGSLQLTVANVDTATRTARDAIRAVGGYVGASEEQRDGDSLVATITYRIPAERWEDTLDGLRKLGTVVGEKTDATEVTSQLVDLDARIRNLKASELALIGYAEKAPKVSDLLEIESRLTDTRGEIERLSAQQAQLTNQVALATLTVTYGTEVVAVNQAAARWDPSAEVDRASATLISVVQGLISIVIVIAIVWVPLVLGALVVLAIAWLVARRLGWRGSRATPPILPPDEPIAPSAPAA